MYKVTVLKHLGIGFTYRDSPKVIVLWKEFELPFTPFIGLEVALKNGKSTWSSGPMRTVAWRVADARFYCSVEPVFRSKTSEMSREADLDVRVEAAEQEGWLRTI